MKKLIAMAVAALAVSAQAAQVQWNSGTLKQPIDGYGTWGASNIAAAGGFMNIWFFTTLADANAFVSSGYTAGNFFASTLAGVAGQTLDSVATAGQYSGVTTDSFALDTQYFMVAYVETTVTGNPNPGMNITWWMYSGVESFTTAGTGNTYINLLSGAGLADGSRAWPTHWGIPEPASGMLALVGSAMMLRRRRRA